MAKAKTGAVQASLNAKLADPIRTQIALNAYITARANMFRRLLDPRRDIKAECGYPSDMTAQEYWELYSEDPLANRANKVYPLECWQKTPTVYEKEKESIATPFEKRWDQIGKSIGTTKSYYKEEKFNKIWGYLKRLDVLCGVGQYGVMLLGFNDDNGGDLRKPLPGYDDTEVKGKMVFNAKTGALEQKVVPGKPKATPNDSIDTEGKVSKDVTHTGVDLKYIRVFPQHLAQITEFESRPNSPRRGHPKFYTLTLNDFNEVDTGGTGAATTTVSVHWSRVIHVADGLESNEIFAPSRLKPCLFPILDARKGRGAGAEGTWKGTFMGMSIESLPQVVGDLDVKENELKNMMESYFNGQDKAIYLDGMTAKPIAPQVGDVTPLVELNIGMICILLGCPIRIFKGSERGELASSQDDDAWNDRLKERHANFIIPSIIVPFVDRLIGVGALPEPPDGFKIDWPDLTSMSETMILTNAQAAATAVTTFISGGGEGMIPKNVFITEYLKKDPETAEMWEQEAEAAIAEAEEEAALVAEEDAKVQADAMKSAGIDSPEAMMAAGGAPGGPPAGPPGKGGFPLKPGAKPPTSPSGKPGAVPPGKSKKPNPFTKNIDVLLNGGPGSGPQKGGDSDPTGRANQSKLKSSDRNEWAAQHYAIIEASKGSLKVGDSLIGGDVVTAKDLKTFKKIGDQLQKEAEQGTIGVFGEVFHRGAEYGSKAEMMKAAMPNGKGKEFKLDQLTSVTDDERVAEKYSKALEIGGGGGGFRARVSVKGEGTYLSGVYLPAKDMHESEFVLPAGVTMTSKYRGVDDDGVHQFEWIQHSKKPN